MTRREKSLLDTWAVLILVGNFLGFASGIILGSFWLISALLVIMAVDVYWYYVRRIKGKKPTYPLVPPDGKGDAYLPRTNIPRPVHADFREAKEKRRRFDKLNRMLRRTRRRRR